jgi:AraC-like DNA-binding protein
MAESSVSFDHRAQPLSRDRPIRVVSSSRLGQAGNRCQINLRFFTPPRDMDGCFTTFYRMELTVPGDGTVIDFLQPEYGNLRFFASSSPDCRIEGCPPLGDADFTATGPSTLPLRFELGTTRMWGVGLFPLGWAKLIAVSAAELANQVVDGAQHPAFSSFAPIARDLFSGAADDEAEFAILIAAFRQRMKPVREEAAIRAVHAAVVDTDMASVAELAERAGMAARPLERLCRRYFGFPPKLLLRRQRFMRTLSAFMVDPGSNWSKVIDGRYHDQAHFVREFQQFMLMTPSEYAALDHPVLAGFMAERKRILGSPAQTLDQP